MVRVWKGYGTREGVDRYTQEHFAGTVLAQLRTIDGFLGANVLIRDTASETQVVVATLWKSMGAVRAFAGNDYERAVVDPVVRDLLSRFDDNVTHFTVAFATREEA